MYMPVYGYTLINFSKYFQIFKKPLVSYFQNTPDFQFSLNFTWGNSISVKKNSQIFCKVAMLRYLADPGKARGCSTNTYVINSLIESSFSPHSLTAPPRRNS